MKYKRLLAWILSAVIVSNTVLPAFATENVSENLILDENAAIESNMDEATEVVAEHNERNAYNNAINTLAYDEKYVASGICGDNLTWVLDNERVLTISGSGEMEYWSAEEYVPEYRKSISSVIIESGVTSIWIDAFANCDNLKSVVISNSVTSIGDYAFANCGSLESLTIPDSVISIGSSAFSNCSSLESVEIPNSVTSIKYGTFMYCESLTNVIIPNSVISIGENAFYVCSSMMSVMIPSSVTSIGDSAFSNCSSLESVMIPESVASMGESVFSYCANLKSVVIQNGVTSIEKATFSHCSSLENVIIPGSVISIGSSAFSFCGSLESLTIPGSVISIGSSAFSHCDSLESVEIPNGIKIIDGHVFGYCSNLRNVTIPKSVTNIGDFAFYRCSNLEDVYYLGSKEEWAGIKIVNKDTVNSCLTSAVIHYNSTGNDSEDKENSNNSTVCYFSKWDAENQIAYFGDNILGIGSIVTEETDTSFIDNIDNLLGEYVYVKTKDRDDELIDHNYLISIEPVETRYGKVDSVEGTIWIDGVEYSIADNLTPLYVSKDERILYHLYENIIVGIQILDVVKGEIDSWDKNTGKLGVISENQLLKRTYILSEMANPTEICMENDGDLVSIHVDDRGYFYTAYRYRDDSDEEIKREFSFDSDKLGFINSSKDFFNEEEQLVLDYLKNKLTFNLIKKSYAKNLYEKGVNVDYQISQEAYNRLLAGLDETSREVIETFKHRMWDGSCFGMAIVEAIHYQQAERLHLYEINEKYLMANINDLDRPRDMSDVESLINFYFLTQFLPANYNRKKVFAKTTRESYQDSLDKLIDCVETKGAVVVEMEKADGSGAHAVILLEVLASNSQYYEVKVADPNKKEPTTMRIYKTAGENPDCIRIAYDSAANVNEKKSKYIYIFNYLDDINELDPVNYVSGMWYAEKEEYLESAIVNVTGAVIVLENEGNKIELSKDGDKYDNVYGPFPSDVGGYFDEDGEYISSQYYIIDKASEDGIYNIEVIPENDAYELNVMLDGFSVSMSGNEGINAYIDESKQIVRLNSSENVFGDFSMKLVSDNPGNNCPIVAVDVEKSKVLEISFKDNNIIVEGDNLDGAHVAIKDNENVQGEEISSETNSIEISSGGEAELDIQDVEKDKFEVIFDCDTEIGPIILEVDKYGYVTFPDEPTKEQYVFAGWFTEKNGKGDEFSENVPVLEDLKLYAYWVPDGVWCEPVPEQIYTGTAIKPDISVYDKDCLLMKGKDYTISYKNNIKPGTAQIIIKGKGNYAKTITTEFEILPKDISDDDIVIDFDHSKQNKNSQYILPIVKWKNKTLKNKQDYIVSYSENIQNPMLITARVEGKGNYTGFVENSYEISLASLDISKTIVGKIPTQYYTGEEIKPDVIVYANKNAQKHGEALMQAISYSIKYENNIAAGTGKIIIEGTNSYFGKKTVTFKIEKRAISEEGINVTVTDRNVIEETNYVYNGTVQKPKIVITDNGRILEEGIDYKVSYSNNTKAATVSSKNKPTITIKGIGNYTGSKKIYFNILPLDISATENFEVIVKDAKYTKKALKPSVTVKWNGKTLKNGTDYKVVKYCNNIELCEKEQENAAYVVVQGIKNFSGEVSETFRIYEATASNFTVDKIATYIYTPHEKIEPEISVYAGKKELLTEGEDYVIASYEGNEKAGTGKIVITGIGQYGGTKTVSFKINKRSLSTEGIYVELKEPTMTYTGSALKPKFKVLDKTVELIEGVDYTVSYTNNKNVAKSKKSLPTVTIKGKGNYTGTIKENFVIEPKDIADESILFTVKDVLFNQKTAKSSKGHITTVTMQDGKKKLSTSSYKVIGYLNNKAIGDITDNEAPTVVISGLGNYTGTKEIPFRIYEKFVSKVSVGKIPNEFYTGKEIEPKPVVNVKISKKETITLVEGEDYILSWDKNVNIGKGKVIITGIGEYGGIKTVTFTILPKWLKWF